MILPVDNKYRIAGDAVSWRIERRRTRRGKDAWEAFKWYGTFDATVAGLGELMVRTSDAASVADALAEVERVSATLSLALAPAQGGEAK
jgi:hypothetical protein